MKKKLGWFTLLLISWGLGWLSHQLWSTPPVVIAQIKPSARQQPAIVNKITPAIITNSDNLLSKKPLKVMMQLLEKNNFSTTLEHFEALQETANEVIVEQAKNMIFTYARHLIKIANYQLAKQLLNLYLQNTFRDVNARLLLAEINLLEKYFLSAIEKLYEAKGYAYRIEKIEQIRKQIRTVVDKRTEFLQLNNNKIAELKLYQQLTQLEPDYAPYFLNLAEAQLALNDINGARRSLYLINQDPDIGFRAQTLLDSEIFSEHQKTTKTADLKTVNIPLLRLGDHFLVDALFNQSQQIRLLIDTGASMTIITPDILKRSHISYLDTGKIQLFNTANGQIKAPIYEIESLTLGEWQVNQIEIGIMPLGNETTFNGLLGMNFLRNFQFFIDQNEASLRLQVSPEK